MLDFHFSDLFSRVLRESTEISEICNVSFFHFSRIGKMFHFSNILGDSSRFSVILEDVFVVFGIFREPAGFIFVFDSFCFWSGFFEIVQYFSGFFGSV